MKAKIFSCSDLAALIESETLHAVFDVRERGEFNAGHIPGATSLPRGDIEFRIAALVPDRAVPLVVYDDGGERAGRAAETLSELGYGNVRLLEGGLPRWRREGRRVASGVNVPSKAFGERVQRERNIPEVTPETLKSWQEEGVNLTVLDVRTPEEYARFCIPGAWNVPGGDLVLWAHALARQPEKTIVVNCAGRTRSIVGTAALRMLGLENIYALKNGTMGWVLAGLELETLPARKAPDPPPESVRQAARLAGEVARRHGVPSLRAAELSDLVNGRNGDCPMFYLLDVRSEEEFVRGHIPGSLNVPGGQAVQRADDFIAVRGAPVVFISGHGARAAMAAYWYRQMGFPRACFLEEGLRSWQEGEGSTIASGSVPDPLGLAAARSAVSRIAPEELARRQQLSPSLLILDVSASSDYEKRHVPGARWISRGWLDVRIAEFLPGADASIVVTSTDERAALLAALALRRCGYPDVAALSGGVNGWAAEGRPIATGLDGCLVPPEDVVLSPSITGDREAMRRYLEWEVAL